MYCNNCGANNENGTKFCKSCGSPMTSATSPAAPTVEDGPVLTWGILSLVFCSCPILGLIFALISRGKVKNCLETYGTMTGRGRTGKVLGTIGFVCTIVMHVIYVIYIIAVIALLGSM